MFIVVLGGKIVNHRFFVAGSVLETLFCGATTFVDDVDGVGEPKPLWPLMVIIDDFPAANLCRARPVDDKPDDKPEELALAPVVL